MESLNTIKKMSWFTRLWNHPVTQLFVVLIVSMILFTQCSLTLIATKSNVNPTEQQKDHARYLSIVTLLVSVGYIIYAITKLICNHTPAKNTIGCNLGRVGSTLLSLSKNLQNAAAAAAAAPAAAVTA